MGGDCVWAFGVHQFGPYTSREVRTDLAHASVWNCHWLATVGSRCAERLCCYPYLVVTTRCWGNVTGLVHASGSVYCQRVAAIGYHFGFAPGLGHVVGSAGGRDAEESPSTACAVAVAVLLCQPYPELSVDWL